jgi:hypothetical protein
LVTAVNPPTWIVTDGSYLYWSDPVASTIERVGVGGGTPEHFATDQGQPRQIVLDSTHVYWVNNLGAAVMRLAKTGGTPEVVAPANQPVSVAVDDTSVYFTNPPDKTVMRAPKTGGTPVLVTNTDLPPRDLIVVGDQVIYQQCDTGGCNGVPTCNGLDTMLTVSKTGGTPSDLHEVSRSGCGFWLISNGPYYAATANVFGPQNADNVVPGAIDAYGTVYGSLYSTGGIRRLGCAPMLMSFKTYVGTGLMTVDDQYLYWVVGNTIRRMPK